MQVAGRGRAHRATCHLPLAQRLRTPRAAAREGPGVAQPRAVTYQMAPWASNCVLLLLLAVSSAEQQQGQDARLTQGMRSLDVSIVGPRPHSTAVGGLKTDDAAAGRQTPTAVPLGGQIIPFNSEQSLVFAEGENFTAASGSSWESREWAKSPHYFASTVADVFHSRRAYLHGPENATAATDGAASTVIVPAAGEYTVLVRYEMPYRFEVPFSVEVQQGGAKKFSRVYGRRTNLKVWPFSAGRAKGSLCGPGLQTECCWPWGATENMVWEGAGVEATVTLAKGPAVISLGGVKDSDYCCFGDRNIDVVVLHPNASDVNRRINGSADPADGQVLPLDGLFSQSGEVFFKVQNLNTTHNLSVQVPLTYDHAPYMGQHDYLNKSSFVDGHPAQGGYITVPPGKTTGWVEVGGFMDTFNHGSWKVSCNALAPPPPPPGNETLCIEETRKACPMGPSLPWNRTECAQCVAKQVRACVRACMRICLHECALLD